ncbi:uncharacterized protein [Diadema setosum]|uniref:uncharacterized protein n=1 Tax=Diadema setosum TaxID=31175 RepID=UPI003B3B5499
MSSQENRGNVTHHCQFESTSLDYTQQDIVKSQAIDFESKKYFVVDGTVHQVVLGGSTTSWRPSQAFTNNVLKILIEEVMGYANVSIATDQEKVISTTQALSPISGCMDAACSEHAPHGANSPSINPEVWLDDPLSLQAWLDTQEVLDLGPIGMQARFGWYVTSALVSNLWMTQSLVIDHWRILQGSQMANYVTVSTKEIEILTREPVTTAMYRGQKYCDRPECTNGVYYPPWCKNTSECVLLLADYPESNFEMLTTQIQSLGLMVGVAWIGANFVSTIQERQENGQPTLFFNWTPNDITSAGAFSRIAFPSCQQEQTSNKHVHFLFLSPLQIYELVEDTGGCDTPWQNVHKVVWRPLVTGAPYVYDLLKDVRFSNSRMESIMYNFYFSRLDMTEFACQWVQRNEGTWEPWIPSGTVGIRRTILLGGLFNSLTNPLSSHSGIEPGARMAVEAVNADPSILQSFKLELAAMETGCDPETSLLSYFKFYEDRGQSLAGLVGPMCSAETEVVASVSKFLNTVVVSYRSDSPSLSSKDRYPFLFRTYPDTTQESYAMVKLFQNFGWGRYAMLSAGDKVSLEIAFNMQEVMAAGGIDVVMNIRIGEDVGEEHVAQSYMGEILSRNARILVGLFPENEARTLLCEAYKQGVTGTQGYQWFLPDWYEDGWWDTDYHNKLAASSSSFYSFPYTTTPSSSHNITCSTTEMVEAIRGYISLSRAYIASWGEQVPGGLTVEQWITQYNSLIEKEGKQPATHAAYAYDTVWAYAFALDRLLRHDAAALDTLSSQQTVSAYMKHLSNTSFSGVTGQVVFLGQDRRGPVSIHQHHTPSTTIIATYMPDMDTTDEGALTVNTTGIQWAAGSQPIDGGPTCMVEGLRQALGSDCRTAIALMNTMLLIIILVSTIILAVFIKRRYDKKVKRTEQHIKQLTLMGLGEGSLITLDEWEMPRENVVLNRKLGEGAFGTVYGGEALLGNCKWAAVAVKTLKLGATVAEKLDFLSEAEMMKRFSHRNVVNLLGVCTRGEPMYAVMEFMLYGDLKTFLLGRRHLVGETSEGSVMTDKLLTSMVLDIACGLSYLASINYVHRDLACRNCLVDAMYVVKIGDFGMTRALYDSDYYRLGKRSKLPVRWMAPESLTEGIFTTMSDVWSLGVVIYEVVTLGSFPYQELSNSEVLEYIRAQNSLQPPDGCSTALATLMMQCWAIQPNHRPTAKDVTDILRQRPNLITPCVGAPLGSIPPEELNSTGLPLSPSNIKHPAHKRSTRSNSSVDMPMGRDFRRDHDEEFLTGHLASVGHIFRASKRRSNKCNLTRPTYELGPSGSRSRANSDPDMNCLSLVSSSSSAPSTSLSSTTSCPSTSQDSCIVAMEEPCAPPGMNRARAKTSATLEHHFLHRIPSGTTFSKLLKKAATQDNIYADQKQHWSLFSSSMDNPRFDDLPLIRPKSSRRGSKRPRSKSLGSKSSGSKSPSSKHSVYVTLSRNGFNENKDEETMVSFVSN